MPLLLISRQSFRAATARRRRAKRRRQRPRCGSWRKGSSEVAWFTDFVFHPFGRCLCCLSGVPAKEIRREFEVAGQVCVGDDNAELLRIECPAEEGCLKVCSEACDDDPSCEGFVTLAEKRCVLLRRCEVAETNNLPRVNDGNAMAALVRLRVWNMTVRTATAYVCVRGCPASSPDYIIVRDYLRSCGPASVVSTRSLSRFCAQGDQTCAFQTCAGFCRPDTECVEFAVTSDLLTCELQDGSCVPAPDKFADEFRGSFRK